MQLKEQIKNYYFEHLGQLTKDKQFHFASRIAAWDGDGRAADVLNGLRDYLTGEEITETLKRILDMPPKRFYGKEQRLPYFKKYPTLYGLHNALFRVRHLKVVYGIDVRPDLLKIVPKKELADLYDSLSEDKQALRILSRFAIDYLMLYETLFEKETRFDPGRVAELAAGYDMDDIVQVHLYIYLVTHTIIADTFFYHRPVPKSRLGLYRAMLRDIEKLVDSPVIRLDPKFEFLVACRICGLDTYLFTKFEQEAAASLSPSGSFIIDKLVGGPSAGLNQLERAEHRNVLYVMSASAYSLRPSLLK